MEESNKDLEVLDEGRDAAEELSVCCATGSARR